MSVIAAMRAGDSVVVGCDTAIYSDDLLIGHADKWVMGTGCALGVVGDWAISQTASRPELLKSTPTPATLVRRLRKALVFAGFPPISPGRHKRAAWDCEWLYVRQGAIWHVDGMLSYSNCGEMAAIGSGGDVAKGAILALLMDGGEFLIEVEAHNIIYTAIDAAVKLSAHCGGDPHVYTVPSERSVSLSISTSGGEQ